MQRHFIYSLTLHLLILIFIVIDLPFSFQKKIPEPEIIGVEIVTHLPEKKVDIPKPDPVPEVPEEVVEEEKMAPPPPPAETKTGAIEDVSEIVEEKKPEEPKPVETKPPEPDPIPVPKPEVKPEPKPEVKPVAKPKTASVKPAAKPKPTKTKEDQSFDELAESILTMDEDKPKKKSSGEGGGKKAPKGLEDGDRERISKQLQPCWVMQEVSNVSVEISVKMGADGRFVSPDVKGNLFGGSAINRSIAEAAQRAILDQRCNDFTWLREKFPDLTTLTLIFNPRDMVGW